MGPDAKDAIPALIEALKDNDVQVRRTVARALGKIGPAAKSAVPALQKVTNDADRQVRDAATLALKRI
jgi:HEAT repeat protein